MRLIMKYGYLFLLFSFIISNSPVNNIIESINNGTYDFDTKNIGISEKYSESLYIKGMTELDGEKSKDYFLDYFLKYPDNKYADDSAVKVAEYYYSKGYYIKSGKWYKKIPDQYPDSEFLDKSISYYLNSLMIVGESDSAKYYAKKYKKEYPKLKFNKNFIKENKDKEITVNNNKNIIINSQSRYSVQIGSYENYQSALSKKRMLSIEGFLCRIDESNIKGKKLYSVRVGYYKKRLSAEKELNRIKSRLGIYDSIIIEVK